MKKLLWSRILVDPVDPNVTESGIILNAINPTEKVRPEKGIVKFVGHKVTEVEIGQKIQFKKMNGKDFSYLGVDYISIQEQDVEGIIG